jgi:NAD-specific glutamate dehydrogenase
MHPIMSKQNALAFSKSNIVGTVTKDRYIDHAASIADLFMDRFNPKKPLSDTELENRMQALKDVINNEVEDTQAQALLMKMIGEIYFVCHLICQIYITNQLIHEQQVCTWFSS